MTDAAPDAAPDAATDASRALRQVSRAIKRGDLAAAERWVAVMNARIAIAQRIGDLIARRPHRNARRYAAQRPRPAPAE